MCTTGAPAANLVVTGIGEKDEKMGILQFPIAWGGVAGLALMLHLRYVN
jgi:hypothetical protein